MLAVPAGGFYSFKKIYHGENWQPSLNSPLTELGAEPDIEVDNRPDLVMKGHDPQLIKGLALVMKVIGEHPPRLPLRPPDLPAYPPPYVETFRRNVSLADKRSESRFAGQG